MEITRGKIPKPKKTIIYGPEGIGKSSLAAKWPDPVFIDTEDSTKEMDVARLPAPSSWQMILDEVTYIRDHPDCKTLVIDTADRAQQYAIDSILKEKQISGIEDIGYGKGYVYVFEKFGKLLNLLDEVVDRGIHVVITAHATMRKFEQPDELGAYDRWEMKLVQSKNCNTSALLREWADMVLFCNYKTHTVTEDKEGKKKKAVGSGQRVMYTTHHSCWDAKNRYGLPDELPLEWEAIEHIFAESVQKTAKNDKKPQKTAIKEEKAENPGQTTPPPDEEVRPKSGQEPKKEETGDQPSAPDPAKPPELDPRIPKALRDLMIAHNVQPIFIKDVVAARGYYPEDMEIWDYDKEFIDGCLIAAWDQVYEMIKERSTPDTDNPFNIPFDGEKELK